MADRRNEGRAGIIIGAVLAVVVLLFSFSGSLATFYTDVLWFRDLGQIDVLWKTLSSQWITFAVFATLFFVLLYANLRIARGMAPRTLFNVPTGVPIQLEEALLRIRSRVEPYFQWLLLGVSVFMAISFGSAIANNWQEFQLALNAVPFGVKDPQFGRDVSFFVFVLPALRTIVDWLLSALVFVLLATALVHVVDGAIRPSARLAGFAPHVKAHLSVIAGLIVLTKAADYWLRIYELNFSPRGQVIGASYTDVHAQLPAYVILIVIALLAGLALMVNIRFKGWRLPAIALGVWIGAAVLIGGVYPALVQQFRVAPNELAAETPYIERNIAATQKAFGIDDVEIEPFAANEDLSATTLRENRATIDNTRLWDPAYIGQAYKQLQEIRSYYVFNDTDVDRYEIDGTRREVLIAARELDIDKLADRSQTWQNRHLSYTHGYGAVVSPVREATPQGRPQFLVRDIPPAGSPDLKIDRPGIYFGEVTRDYVVVNTAAEEFDYPEGADNKLTSYEGEAGIQVGNLLRRAAFALRFQTSQLLFSSYIRPDSKVLFRRQIVERVNTIAPWLRIDTDPYITIVDGKLVWVLDGYTASAYYPYAERYDGVNYIRNSVKVTVDAYDGVVSLYAFDEKDPVLAAWRKVYPNLLKDADALPDDLREHLRYPEQLFRLQAEVYKTYHMSQPRVFYNKEDQWALPGENGGIKMEPYYVLMRLPKEEREDFLLMQPFTPRNRENMIGWMAAKSDPDDYGERLVFAFPKQKLVLGPNQVVAAINQDPTISQQLTLWRQGGSDAQLGNMLVLPIEESILYVQPLYLLAANSPIPQLTRVVVAFGDKVAMEPDLATALSRVFGEDVSGVVEPQPGAGEATPTPRPGAQPRPGGQPSEQLRRAADLYERAIEAQRRGDWAEYGRLIDELGQVLEGAAAGSAETSPAR